MNEYGLFTTRENIERIKKEMKDHQWYARSYEHIKNEVDRMLRKGFKVPKEKGFVFYTHCKRDGVRLTFDPYKDENICPKCGMRYTEENFRRARLCYYHHWLSQMAVLGGIVYLISEEDKYAQLVKTILSDYAAYYASYPNNDNELGPTKVFQSTYMESVWLTYLAGAYDMVEHCSLFSRQDKEGIMNDLFQCSAQVIRDYDEGRNNRQAFNNSALCAVALISQDKELLQYALEGTHGFIYHMSESVLEDGMWYEGDNYHFATVPSLVTIAEMCLNYGINLYDKTFKGHSLKDLFQAPLVSLQPDLTFPSRKDSPYQTYICQRWYAGLYEVAYRRYGSKCFGQILNMMYQNETNLDGRLYNAAGVMDIFPAEKADRSRLDWRGFLNAQPDLGKEAALPCTQSATMQGTGLSIIRQEEDNSYCSLDYGHYGGGHGHPDRLQLTFFAKGRRWLTDYGTGQYYFDDLKWYRSTLSHNTVMVDSSDHETVCGTETIFKDEKEFTLVEAVVKDIKPGVNMSRTLIKFREGPLLDHVEMASHTEHDYDYVLHSVGELELMNKEACPPFLPAAGSYAFLEDVQSFKVCEDVQAVFKDGEAKLRIHMLEQERAHVYTAKSYGSPHQLTQRFPLLGVRVRAASCHFVTLIEALDGLEESKTVTFKQVHQGAWNLVTKAKTYTIKRTENGWDVQVSTHKGPETEQAVKYHYIKSDLKKVQFEDKARSEEGKKKTSVVPLVKESYEELYGMPWTPQLLLTEENQIIRAETFWRGEKDLSASAMLCIIKQELVLQIKVKDDTPCFTGGKFVFDNDSVQLYFKRKKRELYQFLVLPQTNEGCALVLEGTELAPIGAIGVSSEATKDGYDLLVSIPFEVIGGMPEDGEKVEFDLVINDRDKGVRRDKQMIWSGARKGERTYLKNMKHPDECYGILRFDRR